MAGGGGLLDIGVHVLDLALYTVGDFKAEKVLGATYTKFGNRGLGRFRNFVNALRGEEAIATTPEQSLAVQWILDGIYQS